MATDLPAAADSETDPATDAATDPAATDAPVPWLDETEQHAWRSFIAGSRRLLERLDQDLKARGLTHDDYGVLVSLSESDDGRMRMAELALRSVESRSRLSHHIGRLESRGLVVRESCPNDGRGLLAVLTPKGRQLIEATAPHHVSGVRTWFIDRVTPEELAVIGTAFAKVDRAILQGDPVLAEACAEADADAALDAVAEAERLA